MKSRSFGLPFFLFFFAATLTPDPRPQAAAPPQNPALSYPNTPEGLFNLIGDILNATKEKDSAKETQLVRSLLMPENSSWFTDEYGPGFGASLAAAYRRVAPELEQEIKTVYEGNVANGWMSPKIVIFNDPDKVNAPVDHFLNCMNHIVALYQTVFQGDRTNFQLQRSPSSAQLRVVAGDLDGYFVYARGSFRFLPSEILMKLPNERPVRLHLDISVMRSKLIKFIPPRYPEEAAKNHIGGKVIVRLRLDRDGNLQEAKPLEGPPVLSQAVMAAVRQWQFMPTRLDGDPVEVELDVEMGFESH